jgi:hypothetical protein
MQEPASKPEASEAPRNLLLLAGEILGLDRAVKAVACL